MYRPVGIPSMGVHGYFPNIVMGTILDTIESKTEHLVSTVSSRWPGLVKVYRLVSLLERAYVRAVCQGVYAIYDEL